MSLIKVGSAAGGPATSVVSDEGLIIFNSGEAVSAAQYQIGRDADGTNQLHFNVPTGATFEFSVNDIAEMTLSASAFALGTNSLTCSGGGSLTGTWTDLGTVSTADINGGSLDGVTIGAAAAAAATVTALTITQAAGTSGVPTAATITGGAHTGLTAATEDNGVLLNFSATKTWAAGAGPLATQREIYIQAPTYVGNAGGALTITDAATVYIDAAPIQGANITLTNTYALWVDSGASRFDGAVIGSQGTDIASASTIVIPRDGNVFELTGVTAVTLITTTGYQDGHKITLIANESVTITHGTATSGANVTIKLAGASDFSMTADDTLTLVLSTTTAGGQAWREVCRTAI